MNIFRIIRSADWWEYKIPTILGLGYATGLVIGMPLETLVRPLSLFLLLLLPGVIYVSLLNDLTDLKEDLASGKRNGMAALSPVLRCILLVSCLGAGLASMYILREDPLSRNLYLLSWIVFTLYSVPPVRLKKRGLAGVFCDAAGAHFFPSLLMVSYISHEYHHALPLVWVAGTGIWSLSYGLRGILWHQFLDRENDRKARLTTFATETDQDIFQKRSLGIVLIECLALALLLSLLRTPLVYLGLGVCLALTLARARFFQVPVIAIIAPAGATRYHILLSDYYQFFLPVSLLLSDAGSHPLSYGVLLIHLLLFPRTTRTALKDLAAAFFSLMARLR